MNGCVSARMEGNGGLHGLDCEPDCSDVPGFAIDCESGCAGALGSEFDVNGGGHEWET